MKGIIFDLDGVLVHTDELHYLAWKKLADTLQIPFTREMNENLKGVSRIESLNYILSHSGKSFSDAEKDFLANKKNQYYKFLLTRLTEKDVAEDVEETLTELRNRDYKLAVGSSSKNAKLILAQTKLISCFDAISDGNNIKRGKPDPEVFLKAAEFLGLPPAECMVVEDAGSGILAAKSGGFTAVGIAGAKANPKADYRIDKLSDLLALPFLSKP